MPKDIFISHSSKDKPIVDKFIDTILENGLGINVKNVFCTSTEGTKIEPGKDWREEIRKNLLASKVVILIITSNYKESDVCLNEMGVAWACKDIVIPFILRPIDFKNAGVIINYKQIEDLNNDKGLDRLKDVLQDEEIINKPKSDRWTIKKEEFLEFLEYYINKNPFPSYMSKTVFEKILNEQNNLKKALKTAIKEKNKIENENIELRKLKDKKEIQKLDKILGKTTNVAEFLKLVKDVKESLELFKPIIRGIIFIDFSRNDARANGDFYKQDIDDALARKYIYVDDDFSVNWDNSSLKSLGSELRKLERFMEEINNKSFSEWFEELYQCDFDMNNLDFWEEVFKVSIYLN